MKKVRVVNKSNYTLPEYKTSGAAGFDFVANIENPITLGPLERALIPTGLYMEIPDGYELQIRSRSGLALKSGISVLNSPATIDSDFRGELGIILVNLSNQTYTVQPGERVAQGVLSSVEQVQWEEVLMLTETERGKGGFGSTGK